ncbi:MAG TPA: tryptophan synthase subunit alpha [Candidatus Omnitrophota bacterium]|nr:tryptophan synthase subunit alpha [Candidatus Omnitrophota bacterium]HQL41627.1 tryptophan synthase subunit alpha [Candidatus Omnitrophota bacterium]
MNRIDQKFSQLKRNKKKAFIAFITAGDPDLTTTEKLVLAFERSGVDIVELGVPFSDPLADGPTIQAASQRAIAQGVTLKKILALVKRLRATTELPICLMTYYNPVFHFGEKEFVAQAVRAGVDGLIIPDLPPEEAKTLIAQARRVNLATIFFLAPTTDFTRVALINKSSTGFIYYVSVAGVTGARTALPKALRAALKAFQRKSTKPICVGFGISTPAQVREIARYADGVIVGSAIVKEILKNKNKKNLVACVAKFVRSLSRYV